MTVTPDGTILLVEDDAELRFIVAAHLRADGFEVIEASDGGEGLAMATSIAAWVNAGLLYRGLKKQQVYHLEAGWRQFLLQLGLAGAVLGTVLFWGTPAMPVWLDWSVWSRVSGLFIWIVVGAGAYFIALHLAGLRLGSLWRRPHDAE